jgi:hypothetical protein
MFDYSARIEAFRDQRVRLSAEFEGTLLKHRKANRDRLISRLPNEIKGVTIGESSFRPQGSFAMQTVIQTRFADEEYDIDDGLVLWRHQLVDADGEELAPATVREKVREALKDKRFNRQPKFCTNCVRVFYADTDEEKHHVDFPIYRIWEDGNGNEQRELANESSWIVSDPTAVNRWLANEVSTRNTAASGRGTQFRQLVQLMKRFCRSRPSSEWDLPNGMKLTMLVAECQGSYSSRIDVAFRDLLSRLQSRLRYNKVICNLADPNKPAITRSALDQNVVDLEAKIGDALTELAKLDIPDSQDVDSARRVWNWIFKSDGFFEAYDEEEAEKEQASSSLVENRSRSMFTVPWREMPPWLMKPSYLVQIVGRYGDSENSTSWTTFESDSSPLAKHLYLRFQATTNALGPYQAYWQVVNTGNEAVRNNGTRGKIEESRSVGAGGLYSTTVPSIARNERTLYTGSHWIECFLVNKGVCIARSGPFVVNIR